MTQSNEPELVDDLNAKIGVLTRREVEARLLSPLIDALGDEFGRDRVVDIVRDKIIEIAQTQGDELAAAMGGSGSAEFKDSLAYWTKDDGMVIDVLENSAENLHFNVVRCRYAELYRALGIAELGAVLSCNRDAALIQGFNPVATFERTQTIMQGATHCDFRYSFPLSDGAIPLDVS